MRTRHGSHLGHPHDHCGLFVLNAETCKGLILPTRFCSLSAFCGPVRQAASLPP